MEDLEGLIGIEVRGDEDISFPISGERNGMRYWNKFDHAEVFGVPCITVTPMIKESKAGSITCYPISKILSFTYE